MNDSEAPAKTTRKRKRWLGLDPLLVILMAVVATLPFLLVRVFLPPAGPDAQVVKSPVLAASLPDDAAAWVVETLAGLPLEKRIAQLVTADVVGGYIADDDPRLARWLSLARDHGLGMFVFYGGTPRDVARLLNRLQKAAAIPLLISADFEGGPGQQVTGASEFPANMAFAAAGSDDLMYRAAAAAAVEGRAMGIHLTYTPVCDIAWNPDNPAESVRSFGGDLDLLGRMVRAYVRGYHENGMLTSAKHFPGRGDVANMPANPGWAWIDKPAAEVESQEFAAFKRGIDAGVDFVMTEHIAVPSVADGSELPASVEGKLVTGWLKGKLGFKGVVTSDDLWYDHVAARFGAEEVAVRAFEAGHDVILKPKDPVAAIAALAAAVRSGRIAESRIDEAAKKILTLKARLGLYKARFVDEARVGEFVGTAAHQALVQEVADKSMTMLKNDGVLTVSAGKEGARRRRSSTSPSRNTTAIPCRRPLRPSWRPRSRGRRASPCGRTWTRDIMRPSGRRWGSPTWSSSRSSWPGTGWAMPLRSGRGTWPSSRRSWPPSPRP